MGLLTAGYWPNTYWPKNYWPDDYWAIYGYVAPITTSPPERTMKIQTENRTMKIQTENRTMKIN